MSKTIDVRLLGKDYRVACEPAEREALQAAVAFLEDKFREAGEKAPNSARAGGERAAVMMALNLAHELLAAKIHRQMLQWLLKANRFSVE
jgi:cell division protein ZapA